MVKNLPAMQETWLCSLGWEDPIGGGHGNPLQYSCLENPHGQSILVCYSPWGRKELNMTEWLSTQHSWFTDFPDGSDGKESTCTAGSILGGSDPLEKGIATHSSILAWRTPWTQEIDGLYSPRGRKESDMIEWLTTHTHTHIVNLQCCVSFRSSVMHIHLSILFQILFPYRLLLSVDEGSLHYIVGTCWLSILCIVLSYVNPNLPMYLSPHLSALVTIHLFSKSVNLFLTYTFLRQKIREYFLLLKYFQIVMSDFLWPLTVTHQSPSVCGIL